MAFVFGSGWRFGAGFVNPASPGWGLGWVCLGTVCGVVSLVSAVYGVRGWASVSACFWDVCGFVGAPLAPRRFRFRRAVWACVLARVLPVPSPSWLGCRAVFFFFFLRFGLFFFFLFFSFFPGFVVPVPPSLSFVPGWWLSFFFLSVSLFPVVRCYWLGVASFGWVVPPCLCGGPFFFFFFFRCLLGGGLAACGGVGGRFPRLWAVFVPFPPPPFFLFFWGGGGCLFLPLPSLGWRTHWPAFSVVFRAAVFSCVLRGHVPAPWVGCTLYTVGSAPLLAGLGPGSAGWAAAPGGCLWFWVRRLGLFVCLLLCGAGCNLLGGPPPLSPGALWPRVWPAVLVRGVVARRLSGCAPAGFG